MQICLETTTIAAALARPSLTSFLLKCHIYVCMCSFSLNENTDITTATLHVTRQIQKIAILKNIHHFFKGSMSLSICDYRCVFF